MRTIITQDPYRDLDGNAAWNRKGVWPCKWVACTSADRPPFVTAFRCRFTLDGPAVIRVHMTADERYEWWADGEWMGRGSERGDGDHWFFETYDLSLEAGAHVLVARVWMLGDMAPYAQMHVRSGLLFSPQEPAHIALMGTGVGAWEAKRLGGYEFIDPIAAWGTGANLILDGGQFDWNFETGEGEGWQPVVVLGEGSTSRRNDRPVTQVLEPSTLPPMREERWQKGAVRLVVALPTTAIENIVGFGSKPVKFTCGVPIRQADNLDSESGAWTALLRGQDGVTIPPRTCRRILIDLEDYVCTYPEIVTSGGAGSVVRVHWQEALFNEANTKTKGNRDEIEGKCFVTIWHQVDGIGDAFLPDGGSNRRFETLWWQCGRYVEIVVQTSDAPLTLGSLTFRETRYPLEMEARFTSSDARLESVAPLMLRALQMCSHETYMDCPYYEQLMYIGDTRLEALTTYALTRDTRLPRKALRLYDLSRRLDGLTQSRYPTRVFQSIPPFSLWWVAMLHDYARWRDDLPFVRSLMPGARGVVEHFVRQIDKDSLLWAAEGWNCYDWVPTWKDGTPPGGQEGVCGPLTWTFVLVTRLLAELETLVGEPERAARTRRIGAQAAAKADEVFWDEARGLYADDLTQEHFSEHSQCLALLCGLLAPERQAKISANLLTDTDPIRPLARTTIYFSHYLFETYHLLHRTDKILDRMGLWFDLAAQGLKTTVEMPEPTRSDCHAWGAHPLYHYLASILGIRPASMGFRTVRISPDLGPLTQASGALAHPLGNIEVDLRRENGGLHGSVTLPPGLKGTFTQNGRMLALRTGLNKISLIVEEDG
jgi:alpha-L-rhamnosidase